MFWDASIPAIINAKVEADTKEEADQKVQDILDQIHEDWEDIIAPGVGAALTTEIRPEITEGEE